MNPKIQLFFLLQIPIWVVAQDWELRKTLHFDDPISSISTDQQNNVYIGASRGIIMKYDPMGELVEQIELPNTNEPTLIEAFNPLRLFIFYGQNQEITYFERFISNAVTYPATLYTQDFVRLATIGTDHSLWFLEEPQFILRKFNDTNQQPILSLPISETIDLQDVRFMRSHRDLIFIVDFVHGIYILDQFANTLNHIPDAGVRMIQIRHDQLVYTAQDDLVIRSIYENLENRIPLPEPYKMVMLTGDNYFLFRSRQVDVYHSAPR